MVGFADGLKFLVCGIVAGIFIWGVLEGCWEGKGDMEEETWMMDNCEFAIGFLDLQFGGIGFHAEHIVVAAMVSVYLPLGRSTKRLRAVEHRADAGTYAVSATMMIRSSRGSVRQ